MVSRDFKNEWILQAVELPEVGGLLRRVLVQVSGFRLQFLLRRVLAKLVEFREIRGTEIVVGSRREAASTAGEQIARVFGAYGVKVRTLELAALKDLLWRFGDAPLIRACDEDDLPPLALLQKVIEHSAISTAAELPAPVASLGPGDQQRRILFVDRVMRSTRAFDTLDLAARLGIDIVQARRCKRKKKVAIEDVPKLWQIPGYYLHSFMSQSPSAAVLDFFAVNFKYLDRPLWPTDVPTSHQKSGVWEGGPPDSFRSTLTESLVVSEDKWTAAFQKLEQALGSRPSGERR